MELAQLCFAWKIPNLFPDEMTWRDDVTARISRSNAVAMPSDRSTIALKTLKSSRCRYRPLSVRSAWRESSNQHLPSVTSRDAPAVVRSDPL
jgi:hypothetical protein